VESYVTRWLSGRFVPTLLGYDPLLQFVHEVDAVFALKLALDREAPGVFNVVGDGVLPVSTIIKLVGRSALPLPYFLARRLAALLWFSGARDVPLAVRALSPLPVRGRWRQGQAGARLLPRLHHARQRVLAFGAALRPYAKRGLLTEAYV
jgi:UDP-glucose 4-epimerase